METKTRKEILAAALDAREQEVMHYQINIDNYRLAIAEIDRRNDSDLVEFRKQLEELLSSSIREQKKAQIMLDVIASQLE